MSPVPPTTPPRSGPRPSLEEIGGWPAVLGRLAAGQDLTSVESAAALREILEGTATASQIAAFIFGLRCKGETSEELTGMFAGHARRGRDRAGGRRARSTARGHLRDGRRPGRHHQRLDDRCSHRGRRGSAGLQARWASCVVAHWVGRRAGGARGRDRPAACVRSPLHRAKSGSVSASCPVYHPAMRNVVQTRRELGVPTAFNLLGPLANPGRARYQLVGVGDGRIAERLARVLGAAGAERGVGGPRP